MKDGGDSFSKENENVKPDSWVVSENTLACEIPICQGQTFRGQHSDENDSNFTQL